jgi:hypothetical protein
MAESVRDGVHDLESRRAVYPEDTPPLTTNLPTTAPYGGGFTHFRRFANGLSQTLKKQSIPGPAFPKSILSFKKYG